jgi:hypothetical protein
MKPINLFTFKIVDEIVYVHTKKTNQTLTFDEFVEFANKKDFNGYTLDKGGELAQMAIYLGQGTQLGYVGSTLAKIQYQKIDLRLSTLVKCEATDLSALYWELIDLFRELGRGYTISGLAFKAFKKNGYNDKPTGYAFDSRFRDYYFGGRVGVQRWEFEAGYKAPETDLYYYDLNSAYPAALTQKHWYGKECVCTENEKDIIPQSLVTVRCVAEGCFPYKDTRYIREGEVYYDGPEKTTYPTDELLVFDVTGWEYLAAKDLGLIHHVEVLKVYTPKVIHSYAGFVNKFYALKKDGDKYAKIILNGATGKLGQDPRKYQDITLHVEGEKPESLELLGKVPKSNLYVWGKLTYTQEMLEKGEADFNNVATGSSITGYVRSVLMRAIATTPGVLYFDTDSLICRGTGTLDVGDKLGQWKLVGKVKEAFICDKKLYTLLMEDGTTRTASRGVKLTHAQVKDVFNGKEITASTGKSSHSLRFGEREIKRTVKRSKAVETPKVETPAPAVETPKPITPVVAVETITPEEKAMLELYKKEEESKVKALRKRKRKK